MEGVVSWPAGGGGSIGVDAARLACWRQRRYRGRTASKAAGGSDSTEGVVGWPAGGSSMGVDTAG